MRDQFNRFAGAIWPSFIEFLLFLLGSLKASLLPWKEETEEASPTAFLDGLRGYASLFVSFYHLRIGYTDSVHIGYGSRPDATSIFQLPVVRLIFAGQQMVTIFFVVSGYSLALGTFKALKAGEPEKAVDRIRSSVFRRFLRLYLPTIASSFVVLCCLSAGLYDWGHQMDERSGYREPEPEVFGSFAMQLSNWVQETIIFLDIFQDVRHLYYPHSWSIPTEFVKSLQLYILLIALCKLRLVPRAIVHSMAVAYCYYFGYSWLWTFLVGAAVAHLNVMLSDRWPMKAGAAPIWETSVKSTLFLIGLYMLSYPEWDGTRCKSLHSSHRLTNDRPQHTWLSLLDSAAANLVGDCSRLHLHHWRRIRGLDRKQYSLGAHHVLLQPRKVLRTHLVCTVPDSRHCDTRPGLVATAPDLEIHWQGDHPHHGRGVFLRLDGIYSGVSLLC